MVMGRRPMAMKAGVTALQQPNLLAKLHQKRKRGWSLSTSDA